MKLNCKTALFMALALVAGRLAAQEPPSLVKFGEVPFPVAGVAANGGTVSLAALKGQVVLLYLFSTKPGPGMAELRMISLNTWTLFKGQGLKIIGVVREADAMETARVAAEMHIDFPLIPDLNKEIFLHFAERGHPRAYVIGKDGTVKLTSLGYTDDELDRIEAVIQRELRS